jgi:hypothetical protein
MGGTKRVRISNEALRKMSNKDFEDIMYEKMVGKPYNARSRGPRPGYMGNEIIPNLIGLKNNKKEIGLSNSQLKNMQKIYRALNKSNLKSELMGPNYNSSNSNSSNSNNNSKKGTRKRVRKV